VQSCRRYLSIASSRVVQTLRSELPPMFSAQWTPNASRNLIADTASRPCLEVAEEEPHESDQQRWHWRDKNRDAGVMATTRPQRLRCAQRLGFHSDHSAQSSQSGRRSREVCAEEGAAARPDAPAHLHALKPNQQTPISRTGSIKLTQGCCGLIVVSGYQTRFPRWRCRRERRHRT